MSVTAGSEIVPTAVDRWKKISEELNRKNILAKCHTITSDSQLRWFQVRLLRKLLQTNRFISAKNYWVTRVYILWPGEGGRSSFLEVWYYTDVLVWITMLLLKYCNNCSKFSFSEEFFLYGTTTKCTTDKLLNLLYYSQSL